MLRRTREITDALADGPHLERSPAGSITGRSSTSCRKVKAGATSVPPLPPPRAAQQRWSRPLHPPDRRDAGRNGREARPPLRHRSEKTRNACSFVTIFIVSRSLSFHSWYFNAQTERSLAPFFCETMLPGKPISRSGPKSEPRVFRTACRCCSWEPIYSSCGKTRRKKSSVRSSPVRRKRPSE